MTFAHTVKANAQRRGQSVSEAHLMETLTELHIIRWMLIIVPIAAVALAVIISHGS